MAGSIDLKKIWAALVEGGLADRPPSQWNRDEILALTNICGEEYRKAHSYHVPYFKDGDLFIPEGAPDEVKFWKNDWSDLERYQAYKRMGVPDCDMLKYMCQRALDVALGKCDIMGRPKK